MAKVSVTMPDDFLMRISKLGARTDEIVSKVLESGGEVVMDKVMSNLQRVTSGNSTGQLAKALGVSPAHQNRDGDLDVKIGFSTKRDDGKSNGMIAGILEYGRQGQPPRPFMKPAKSQSKNACVQAMIARFDSEVDKL